MNCTTKDCKRRAKYRVASAGIGPTVAYACAFHLLREVLYVMNVWGTAVSAQLPDDDEPEEVTP